MHLTQIVGDKMQKVDLCDACAAAKGVNDPAGVSLAELLTGLGAAQESEPAAGGGELKCPQCGFTQADFKKAGRFGCAECYNTFAEGLEALLKSMHKGVKHMGKSPHHTQHQARDYSEKLKTLQKRLDKAVADEDFEQAAQMRDEIKAVREKITGLSAPS